ncbi:thioredoxin family protein [Pseudoduganella ginsengisoli]|uniref:Thioredoxin family protein n=1 Tax=Pseudoduganella ginsengisoli TaxID=1462440 RepID=A0A6L6Q1D2_9BURK|nr:thioredoxin family protein [Pseudoduganella ginsengisoli]MTW03627.1 thioredoxin family protein [Pseudoduganella ginsengisoli]
MKSKATFYHAGCPVCVSAEQAVASAIDTSKYDLEIVHFGNARNRIDEAEKLGVKSVPALVLDGGVYHINFGASMADVRG